jgi:hypothetical protein
LDGEIGFITFTSTIFIDNATDFSIAIIFKKWFRFWFYDCFGLAVIMRGNYKPKTQQYLLVKSETRISGEVNNSNLTGHVLIFKRNLVRIYFDKRQFLNLILWKFYIFISKYATVVLVSNDEYLKNHLLYSLFFARCFWKHEIIESGSMLIRIKQNDLV